MASKYTKELLERAVRESVSHQGVLRFLGLKITGGTQTYLKDLVKRYGLDTSHFTGQGHFKGKHPCNRRSPDQVLTLKPEGSRREVAYRLRRALFEVGVEYVCKGCGLGPTWAGKKLVLQVDHQDGNINNNVLENLRFLCPNCHSQTENFGSLNKKLTGS